uniref:C2H2-type domain-containing protein n=1 Tax=Knipowitschia caucasica TaxID=637954 RepID=A0AAV2LHZ8_KNICA
MEDPNTTIKQESSDEQCPSGEEHPLVGKPHECPECGKEFSLASYMRVHLRTVHSKDRQRKRSVTSVEQREEVKE